MNSRYLFGMWGPYRELSALELDQIARTVAEAEQTMTWAITPYWIERDARSTAYVTKFPEQADVVRRWILRGVVIPAAHGMYHCMPGRHRPRWVGMNRQWHRESPTVAPEVAQGHLEAMLEVPVEHYVHPGEPAAPGATVFHDREFVLTPRKAFLRLTHVLQAMMKERQA